MDFRFDADDRIVIDAVAESLSRHLPMTRLRAGAPADVAWRGIAADGWLDAGLGGADGGLELPLVLQCALAREAGRVLAVEAWVNNAVLIRKLIAGVADAPSRAMWLAAHRDRAGLLLVDGRRADLVGTEDASVPWCFGWEAGLDAYRLRNTRDALLLERVAAADLAFRPVADLAVGVGAVSVGAGPCATAALALDRAAVLSLVGEAELVHSAALVGLAERAEAVTVEYVKIREQFGERVGKFQAVKHLLADVRVQNEIAANSVFYAALSRATDRHALRVSRLQATQAASTAARTMIQLHGGFGFTWEADVHYFLKVALAGAARFGPRDEHAVALGRDLVAST